VTEDGPKFLGAAPDPAAPPPTPPRPSAPPPVRARAPRPSAPPPPEPAPAPAPAVEPDWLARALGPGKMPRVMMRFPRAAGVALIAMGAISANEIRRYVEEGGWHSKSLPVLCTVGLFLGAWFVITGRPADARGYSPDWWNRGYVGVLVAAGIAALVIAIKWM
jgi:hypothetical protein